MKKVFRKSFITIVFALLFLLLSATGAFAYVNVEQSAATPTSATVKWNAVDGATNYEVYYYLNGAPETYKMINVTNTKATVRLDKKKSYRVEVYALNSAGGLEDSSGALLVRPAPGKVSNVKPYSWAINGKSGVFGVNKNPYPNIMEGIQWQVLTKNGKKVKAKGTSTSTRFTVKVPSNQVYKLKVRGYSQTNKKYYGPWHTKVVVPEPKLNKSKLIQGKNPKIKVSWRKVKGATKYVVYASTNPKKGYKKVGTVKKNKNSLVVSKVKGKKLKKYKNYYFQVQAVSGKVKSTKSNYLKVFIYTVYK